MHPQEKPAGGRQRTAHALRAAKNGSKNGTVALAAVPFGYQMRGAGGRRDARAQRAGRRSRQRPAVVNRNECRQRQWPARRLMLRIIIPLRSRGAAALATAPFISVILLSLSHCPLSSCFAAHNRSYCPPGTRHGTIHRPPPPAPANPAGDIRC